MINHSVVLQNKLGKANTHNYLVDNKFPSKEMWNCFSVSQNVAKKKTKITGR